MHPIAQIAHLRSLALLLGCAASLAAAAQSACTSDGQPRPRAVLERFINADCEACWRDAATPKAGADELAIDWVVPGAKGEDAPLSAVASPDALARLEALRRKQPATVESTRAPVVAPQWPLRAAQGPAVNDYIGTSIEMPPALGPWRAWLLLVEELPAGTEGSPVPRNLVRNLFRMDWTPARRSKPLEELRSMQIHEGAQVERLKLVAMVHDRRGRLVSVVETRCGG